MNLLFDEDFFTIPLFPHRNIKLMTPRQYIALFPAKKKAIKSSRFIAPKLGDKNFGILEVELNENEF